MWRKTTRQSFPHSQPTFLHILMPSWQLTVSMHQMGSLICNKHEKLMVKMTILFLLCMHEYCLEFNPGDMNITMAVMNILQIQLVLLLHGRSTTPFPLHYLQLSLPFLSAVQTTNTSFPPLQLLLQAHLGNIVA